MKNGKPDYRSRIAQIFSPEHRRRIILVVFASTVTVRFLFCWVVRPLLGFGDQGAHYGQDSYELYAENLLRGEGFAIVPGTPSIMRGPVYPLLGAATFLVFGSHNPIGVQVVNAVLDGLTAVLLFVMGRKIFDNRVGFVAGMLFAVYPLSVWHSAKMEMVSLLTLLYVGVCWWVVKSFDSLSLKVSLAIGLLLGVTTLTLPITLPLPLLLLVAWLVRYSQHSRVLWHTILVSVVMVLVVAPWTIRNYKVSGHFVPVSTGGGYAVLLGDLFAERFNGFTPFTEENPSVSSIIRVVQDERVRALFEREGVEVRYPHHDIPADASSVLNRHALGSISERPLRFARKILIQLWTFWYLGTNTVNSVVILLSQIALLLPWLLVGLYSCWKKRVYGVVPILLLILYFNALYAVTVSVARHGMPAMALALIVSAYGICDITSRIGMRRRSTAGFGV